MLVHFGVTPYLVFDGDRLPSKSGTEKSRRDRRKESRVAGMELLKMGKTSQAHQELQKAVDITPEMARMLIEELKRNNVQYVVAPYEADSQMAYLEKKGIIDGILSEDSDLLVFGAKTLLTKLDQYGDCIMVRQDDFTACRDINLVGWTCDDFRRMAILSGCDYLEGIHKMGLKTAHRMLRKYKTVEKVVRFAQLEGKLKIPAGYLDAFTQAENTFLYQWVYCPEAKRMVNLTQPESEDDIAGLEYIGRYIEPEMAARLAAGDVNPMTKQPIIISATPNPSYYKRTPLLSRSKTVDSAKHKPINSFFLPASQRTPLAELDLNSFTPSPSQQRVLAANANRSWQPDSVEMRPSSAPSRAVVARPALLGRTNSAPHAFKRQKLCAEEESASVEAATDHEELPATQRSRFFGGSTYQPSPLGAKAARNKSKQKAINLWSDDSIEEAMATLPDMSTQTKSTPSARSIAKIRKFAVFAEPGNDTKPSPSQASPEPSHARPISDSDEDLPDLNVLLNTTPADPFAAALRLPAGSLKDQFSFTSLATPPLTNTQSSRNGSSFIAAPATPPDSQLQQPEYLPSAIEETPCHARPDVDCEGVELPSRSVSPAVSKVQQVSLGQTRSVLQALAQGEARPRGSEDLMLVPDSEADLDLDRDVEGNEDGEEDEELPTMSFDVSQFAFLG